MIYKGQFFGNISFDSLQKPFSDKLVLSLKLQTIIPIHFVKGYKPQSSNTVELEDVFNPVFQSNEIDSIDCAAEKELISANEELSWLKDRLSLEDMENASYQKSEEEAFVVYDQLLMDVYGNNIVAKEGVIKVLHNLAEKSLGVTWDAMTEAGHVVVSDEARFFAEIQMVKQSQKDEVSVEIVA